MHNPCWGVTNSKNAFTYFKHVLLNINIMCSFISCINMMGMGTENQFHFKKVVRQYLVVVYITAFKCKHPK